MSSLSRRDSLKILGALSTGSASAGVAVSQDQPATGASSTADSSMALAEFASPWHRMADRIWIGPEFWANPMEGWVIRDGGLQCAQRGGNRNVHLITHHLRHVDRSFETSVTVSRVDTAKSKRGPSAAPIDDGVGFLIGVRSELDETKSNCFARKGLTVGIREGGLQIGPKRKTVDEPIVVSQTRLKLVGVPDGNQMKLTLTATSDAGVELAMLTHWVPAKSLAGNIALVNSFDPATKPSQSALHRFTDWRVVGDAFEVTPQNAFGPILWSMYSLSDSRSDEGFVMKMSALLPPLGTDDNHDIELQVQRDGRWQSLGTATADTDAWTAVFRIANWDASTDVPFRLTYLMMTTTNADAPHSDGTGPLSDGTGPLSDWTGTIKANPTGRPVKFAPLTCQNDYAFPYAPVAENLMRLDPDLIYFSGDQIYESHGGYGLIRDPAEAAIVNYLRKFYMFGWAFREPMRFSPTLCIPDDHDVFQGNIWGEGGEAMVGIDNGASSKGGYREPVRMVNAVHRTCTGHHPDPFDPTPAKRDMSVYYGDMVYGGVSFAILADRQFKSGPERVDTGSGRADHVLDPAFDTRQLDEPELELLGERQESFLRAWAADWRGASIKVLLSQTVFAGVATHHGAFNGYLKADLDSGGWPQTARDRTIDILRTSGALHVNGDQHLTSLVQYGVHEQRDSNWSFCVPAIAAGYPRWWRPDDLNMPHAARPDHGLPQTGQYRDGLGNAVYVYAVGNPVVGQSPNRYEKAHEKGSGLGYIVIDPESKTYEIHSYRFLVDVTDGNPDNEFPGWPVTIHADENAGKNRLT